MAQEKRDAFYINGPDGIVRGLDEHYETQKDIEQDPYGAHLAIQDLWQERENWQARAWQREAERDKLLAVVKLADDNLTNLQPKIANLVHKDWVPVFDGYIDPVINAARAALEEINK